MNIQNEYENENEGIAKSIVEAVKGIKYGYIQVTIHNSKIVQIDKTEKIRLDPGQSTREGVSKV